MKTDAELQQDVMAELRWEPALHAARIGVAVSHGVVTLNGDVNSFVEKWSAEQAAQRVAGVKAVATEMQVKRDEFGLRNDADIANAAQQILNWTSSLPVGGIKVLVESGWLTLSGAVEWQYQRQDAASAVRYLPGVTGVSNQIAITGVSATVVKADIEAALKRSAWGDAKHIAVAVHGAEVTLTGTVHNFAERELVTLSAWSAPGVHHVFDKMKLA